MSDRGINPQSDRCTRSHLCVLFITSLAALFALLVAPTVSRAEIDLLGRTEATFTWQHDSDAVISYDVYIACDVGQAPDDFDEIAPEPIPADPPSVTISAEYGEQCRIRVAAWDQFGRVSPVSLVSDRVNFVEPPPADNDFDDDGTSDIIVQDPDDGGAVLIPGSDLKSGDALLYQRTTISTAGNGNWILVETGDFDGDNSPDFVWKISEVDADTGVTLYTYFAGSKTYNATIILQDVTEAEEIIAISDFNGDGIDDILHRTDDVYGTVWVTFMDPDRAPDTRRYPGVLASQFDFVASGDFDGDGNDDVMWRRQETGQTVIWLMADAAGRMSLANSGVQFDPRWVGEASGNFNNAPQDDILWRDRTTGETLIWYMDDLNQPDPFPLDVLMPGNWSLLASGDLNRDGRADLTWIDWSTNLLEVWRMDENLEGGFSDE